MVTKIVRPAPATVTLPVPPMPPENCVRSPTGAPDSVTSLANVMAPEKTAWSLAVSPVEPIVTEPVPWLATVIGRPIVKLPPIKRLVLLDPVLASLIVTVPAVPTALLFAAMIVPARRVVPPLYEFADEIRIVPAPALTSPAAPPSTLSPSTAETVRSAVGSPVAATVKVVDPAVVPRLM